MSWISSSVRQVFTTKHAQVVFFGSNRLESRAKRLLYCLLKDTLREKVFYVWHLYTTQRILHPEPFQIKFSLLTPAYCGFRNRLNPDENVLKMISVHLEMPKRWRAHAGPAGGGTFTLSFMGSRVIRYLQDVINTPLLVQMLFRASNCCRSITMFKMKWWTSSLWFFYWVFF